MDKVAEYLGGGYRKVRGWLNPFSARVIAHLSSFQRTHGISGATGEIGVHHGKLWIVLHLTTDPTERCFAVDLFGDQTRNVDGSGRGDLAIFTENLKRYSVSDSNVVIIQASSLDVTPERLTRECGKVRFFSVDGGHTAECTLNDLLLAERSTLDEGIVILDDYFNPHWPDVSSGAAAYFLRPDSRLRPFAISPNKLYLARTHFHELYRRELKTRFSAPRYFDKSSIMFGSTVEIYGITEGAAGMTTRLGLAARRLYWRSLSARR